MTKNYIPITWVDDIQGLMDKEGFAEHSYLINDEKGMEDFGSSSYFVEKDWYLKVTSESNIDSALANISSALEDIVRDIRTIKIERLKGNFHWKANETEIVQQALNKVRDLSNTIEGALAGEESYPDTYYRMCQDIIECLTKINKIV